jgi:hypothetical protein
MVLHQLLYPHASLDSLKIGEQCNATCGVALFIDGFICLLFLHRWNLLPSRWVFLLHNFFISLFVSSEVEVLGARRLAGERKFPIMSSMDNLAVDGVLDPGANRVNADWNSAFSGRCGDGFGE